MEAAKSDQHESEKNCDWSGLDQTGPKMDQHERCEYRGFRKIGPAWTSNGPAEPKRTNTHSCLKDMRVVHRAMVDMPLQKIPAPRQPWLSGQRVGATRRGGIFQRQARDAAEQTKSGGTIEMQTMEHTVFDLVNARVNPRARARRMIMAAGRWWNLARFSPLGCAGNRWRSVASPDLLSEVSRGIPAAPAMVPCAQAPDRHQFETK
jgi:hypothetical protein